MSRNLVPTFKEARKRSLCNRSEALWEPQGGVLNPARRVGLEKGWDIRSLENLMLHLSYTRMPELARRRWGVQAEESV